jgi:hypothetical protein
LFLTKSGLITIDSLPIETIRNSKVIPLN